MTKSEEMKRLEYDMASDKELRKKFCKTVDRIAGEKTVQSDGELADGELDYNITAADFEWLDAEMEEVSADELKQVAGCVGDHEDEHGHDTHSALQYGTALLHQRTLQPRKRRLPAGKIIGVIM